MKIKFILAIAIILCAFCVLSVNALVIQPDRIYPDTYNIGTVSNLNQTVTFEQNYLRLWVYPVQNCEVTDINLNDKSFNLILSEHSNTAQFVCMGYKGDSSHSQFFSITKTVNYNYVGNVSTPQPIIPIYINSEYISQKENSITYKIQAKPITGYEGIQYSEITLNQNPEQGTLTSEQTIKYINIGTGTTTVYCKWFIPSSYTNAGSGVISKTLVGTVPPLTEPTPEPTIQPTVQPTVQPTEQPIIQPNMPNDLFPTGDFGLQLITGKSLDQNVVSSMGLYKIDENSITTTFKEGERIYFYIDGLDYVNQIANGIGTVDYTIVNYDTMEEVFPSQRYKNNWSENNQWQYKSDSSSTIYNIGSNTDSKTLNFVSAMSAQYIELPEGRYRCYVNVRYGGDVYNPNLILTGFYTDFRVIESETAPKLTFTIESINYDTGNQLQGVNLTVYEYHDYDNSLQEIYRNANSPAKVQLLLPSSSMLFIQANINNYKFVNEETYNYLDNREGKLISVSLGSARLYFTKVSTENIIDKSFRVIDDNLQPVQNVIVTMDNSITLYTNEYGGVRFNDIAQGIHSFTFSKNGYNTLNLNMDISISSLTEVQIFRIQPTVQPTAYPTIQPTIQPTVQPTYTPIDQPTNLAESVKYGLAKVFGVNSLNSINLIFALMIILFPAVVAGVITNQALAFVAGGLIGFVFTLALGLIPIWIFFAMVMLTVIYLVLTHGNEGF